jgi:drug/metabolite transporter (DMT)-like permease
MGTAATAALATAMAIEPVAHVRTLALVELLFSYAVSHRIFREKLTQLELVGVALLVVGVVTIALGR